MKKYRWLFSVLITLLLAACQSGGGGPRGLILYQPLGEDGRPQPELVIISPQGEEQERLSFSGPVTRSFVTPGGRHVVIHTLDAQRYLVDAAEGTAQLLDLPEEVRLDFGRVRGGGERWALAMAGTQGSATYLVNLETGQTTPLTRIQEALNFIITGTFSPDEGYLCLWGAGSEGDELWLIPTEAPAKARRLGQSARVCSFASDGERVAYVQRDESDQQEAVVEAVDGSEREVAASGSDIVWAFFVPGQDELVLADKEKLSLQPLNGDPAQELLAYAGFPLSPWFSPEGKKLLLGVDTSLFGDDDDGGRRWQLVDLEKGSAQALDELDDLMPAFQKPDQRWLFFLSNVNPLEGGGRFVGLDLQSGQTREALVLDEETRFLGQMETSSDGKQGLVTVNSSDKKMQLWLLRADSGENRMLAEAQTAVGGTFSPDGQWVAVGALDRSGETPQAHLRRIATEGEEAEELGAGIRPVWVRP